MTSSTITLDGVSKEYAGGVRAIDDVSLEVAAGEFVVLVGPSGCGKSTLLRMVAGLEELTDGRVFIGDQDVSHVDAKHRDVAMVFQSYALFPHMTVGQNIGFGLRMRRTPKAEMAQRVAEAARILELSHLLDRRPAALSGGQRQRVAMGRALVRDARAFLMDEPLSNLDAQLRGVMRTELRQVHQRVRGTTLYVTHDQIEALTLGDRVAVLREGILQQCATPTEIFNGPANVFVAAFIGSPAMNLVQATVTPDGLRAGSLALPGAWAVGPRASVVVGLRPGAFEDAALARDEARARLQVVPAVVEDLGDEKHIVFQLDAPGVVPDELRADDAVRATSTTVTARVHPGSRARVGEPMELAVDAGQAYLFDAESGTALRG